MGKKGLSINQHFFLIKWLQDSRSFGAVAGLAFAIVFTWRLLRTPRGSQRRPPKRQASSASSSGVSNHASGNAGSSEVATPPEDPTTQNVIDELFQPVKVDKYSL